MIFRSLKTICITCIFATLMMGSAFADDGALDEVVEDVEGDGVAEGVEAVEGDGVAEGVEAVEGDGVAEGVEAVEGDGVAEEVLDEIVEIDPLSVSMQFVFEGMGEIDGERKEIEVTLGDFTVEGEVGFRAERIYELAPFLVRRPKDAEVYLGVNGNLAVSEEAYGVRVDLGDLRSRLVFAFENMDFEPIEVKYEIVPPRVHSSDLEEVLPRLSEIVDKKITLMTEVDEGGGAIADKYTFDVRKNFDALKFEFTNYLELGGRKIPVSLITKDAFAGTILKKDWVLGIHAQAIDKYIRENLAEDLELPSMDVKITMGEDGRAVFEGTAQNGILVDRMKLIDNILVALNDPAAESAVIPLKEVKGLVEAPEELRERGITELFSVGYSNFWGSPWRRVHNIETGLSKFNGLIIPKDSVFSFNEHLGAVDASTGYLEELVILGDETKPEYGGGLCQVSSTFFRAGLFGGLNIAERRAHSYAVSYYARPGGHGLDCTVYLGGPDCKIINDTPGDLLIQAYNEGTDAYFKFYGTVDGRTVSLDGPYYSKRVAAPPDKIIYDPELPEDHYEEKEQPHNGFDAVWYRTVKAPDGTESTQTFQSHYQARPKVIIRGGEDPDAETENAEE